MSNQDENFDEYVNNRKNITSIVIVVLLFVIIIGIVIGAFFVSSGSKDANKAEESKTAIQQEIKQDPNSDFVAGVVDNSTQVVEDDNKVAENTTVANTTNTTTTDFSNKTNATVENGYTPVDETVYATTTVRVRPDASTNKDPIGSLFTEQSVKRIAIGDDGWSKVIYKNQEAYVFSEYLTTEAPPERPKIDVKVRGNSTVDPNQPMVALTFDDGPNPYTTNLILDILEQYNVKATFFDLGSLMAEYPDVVEREEAIGCEVASHTYNHKNLNLLSEDDVEAEQNLTEAEMQKILGHVSSLIRPPYGNANTTVRRALEEYGLIGWDIDSLDWKSRNANSVLSEIRKFSDYDGRIILMHGIYESTATAVETLVPELLEKGYQLVTVSEMIKAKGVELEGGKLYYNFRD